MNPDLRVRPVIHRLPADEIRALRLTEGRLDLIAVPIGQDDLIRAPLRMIGEKDVLSEPTSVIPQHLGIRPNRHPVIFLERDVNFEDRGDVAFGQDVIDFALDRVQRCPAVGPGQIPAQVLKPGLRLPDRPAQPVDLFPIGPGIVGHDDRPFPVIDCLRRPVSQKGLFLFVGDSDRLVVLKRYPAEVGMMVRRESSDKRQPRVGVDPGDILRRVAAASRSEISCGFVPKPLNWACPIRLSSVPSFTNTPRERSKHHFKSISGKRDPRRKVSSASIPRTSR